MRVLHVAPSITRAYGGPTESLAGYVKAAVLGGVEVAIAAPNASVEEVDALKAAGASDVRTFPSFGPGALSSSPSLVSWIGARSKYYDITHVHGLFNPISTLSARQALRAGSAVIIRPFGTLSRYTFAHRRGTMKRVYFRLLERSNLEMAAGIHFTTAAELEGAEWHSLSLARKSYVVPPPWVSADETVGIKAKTTGPVVLFLGRINRVKNLGALIAAWPAVIRARPDARLVIAGTGDASHQMELRRQAERLGVASSVSFPGFVTGKAKAQALGEASLFVLPSHHENFGIAVLEAVAAGVPVVISPEVQLGSFITTHQLGSVAESSPEILASAIVHAVSDRSLGERVATRGRRIVEETYGAAVVCEQLCSMYLAAFRQHSPNQRIS